MDDPKDKDGHDNAYLHNKEEAIKLALQNEIKVRKFYLDHAEKMKGDLAKKTFIFLADEELKHEETIREFVKNLKNGANPDLDPGPANSSVDKNKEFFGMSVGKASDKVVASQEELDAYEMAAEIELKGYKFYEKSASEATHENIKHLFTFLTKEENAHYHLITNTANYLKNPETFIQDQEDWFFEGG
ncbi:ferritin family protein [Candidatus Woesearchaeota archaeon]|nr:ferritin family protein [Candidatus Woesearchaeota archaeon]